MLDQEKKIFKKLFLNLNSIQNLSKAIFLFQKKKL